MAVRKIKATDALPGMIYRDFYGNEMKVESICHYEQDNTIALTFAFGRPGDGFCLTFQNEEEIEIVIPEEPEESIPA